MEIRQRSLRTFPDNTRFLRACKLVAGADKALTLVVFLYLVSASSAVINTAWYQCLETANLHGIDITKLELLNSKIS